MEGTPVTPNCFGTLVKPCPRERRRNTAQGLGKNVGEGLQKERQRRTAQGLSKNVGETLNPENGDEVLPKVSARTLVKPCPRERRRSTAQGLGKNVGEALPTRTAT